MRELCDRVAVVTGAASGIGLGIASAFVAEGMRVVLTDVDQARLEREVAALGDSAYGIVCDVGDPDAVDQLAREVLQRFGAVHLLCNNAGILRSGRSWEIPLADWNAVLRVNLLGALNGIRSFLPPMLASGEVGHVVNVASMAAVVPVRGIGPYNVSKHGLLALTDTLYMELHESGAPVGVSLVMPGRVPSRLGRAPDDPTEPTFDATEVGVRSASDIGRIVVEAVRQDERYVFTHRERIVEVEQRFAGITSSMT
jgi:NAD(P)-dependent dehydrogenase (short-subunit alcohol dehydrogenase family)